MKDYLSGFRLVVIFLFIMAVAMLIFVTLFLIGSSHESSGVYITAGYLSSDFFKEPFEIKEKK